MKLNIRRNTIDLTVQNIVCTIEFHDMGPWLFTYLSAMWKLLFASFQSFQNFIALGFNATFKRGDQLSIFIQKKFGEIPFNVNIH